MMPGFDLVPFNDLAALEKKIAANASEIAAFMVEPIQVTQSCLGYQILIPRTTAPADVMPTLLGISCICVAPLPPHHPLPPFQPLIHQTTCDGKLRG
jgi:hypothetical protein